MRLTRRRRLVLVSGTLAGAAAVLAAAAPPAASPGSPRVTPQAEVAAAYARETARIRLHFDSVLAELRAADARALTSAQRAARADRIATLEAYRDRGVFPHNHQVFDRWTPYFVDHRGVLCAVAHLMEASGRRDIVDRVAAADNDVWVVELANDTAFRTWLDASGLTLAEAARIQVPYVGTPDEPQATSTNRTNDVVAVVAGGLGAASIAWSARAEPGEHRVLRSVLGLTAGVTGVAIASSRNDARGAPLAIGVASGVVGLGSALMGVRALMLGGEPRAARQQSAAPTGVSVTPAVVSNGARLVPGVSVSLRF